MTAKKYEHKLTLAFETEEDLDQWVSWYLDGGGEQDASYFVKMSESNWQREKDKILVLDDPERCPVCKSKNWFDLTDPAEHMQKRTQFILDTNPKIKKLNHQFLCEDCHCNFDVEEE